MKKEVYITVSLVEDFGQPPKTPEEKARDEALAQELLQHIRQMRNVKILSVSPKGYSLKIVNNEEAFRFVMEALQPAPHLVSASRVRVWKTYTHQELESAPLLVWRLTNQAIEDDYYDLEVDGYQGGEQASHRRCPACRAELAQVRDLLVKTHKMGKRDLSLTYGFEVILSARLAQMLQESGLTGFTLRPVWNYRRPYQGEPRLFQLVVTNTLPPMASPPTEFEEDWPRPKQCDVCGRRGYYLKHTHYWGRIRYYEETDVYYPKEVVGVVQDFNIAAERFGELRDLHQLIIITQRVYRWLREQKVKGWAAVPVYLVE